MLISSWTRSASGSTTSCIITPTPRRAVKVVRRAPEQQGRACAGPLQAEQQGDRGRLAGAVGPKDGQQPSRPDFEVESIEGLGFVEPLANALQARQHARLAAPAPLLQPSRRGEEYRMRPLWLGADRCPLLGVGEEDLGGVLGHLLGGVGPAGLEAVGLQHLDLTHATAGDA